MDCLGLKMTDSEYAKLWKRFDTSGDGTISYPEFNNRVGILIHPMSDTILAGRVDTPRLKPWQQKRVASAVRSQLKNLEDAFKEIDTDSSGRISHAEFILLLRKLGLSKLGDEESFQMMKKYDDGSGLGLTLDQFKATMSEYLNSTWWLDVAAPRLPHGFRDRGLNRNLNSLLCAVPVHEAASASSIADPDELKLSLTDAEKILAEKLYGKFNHVQRAFRQFDSDKSGAVRWTCRRFPSRDLPSSVSDRPCTPFIRSAPPTLLSCSWTTTSSARR